jgi:hypothetical protein
MTPTTHHHQRKTPKLRVDSFLMGAIEQGGVGQAHWTLSDFNTGVAFAHLLQAIVVMMVHLMNNTNKPSPFVAGTQQLRLTTQAVVPSDQVTNECVRGNMRPENRLTLLRNYTGEPSILDTNIYDFSDILIYQYYEIGSLPVATPWVIFTFFLLSFFFQFLNTLWLHKNADAPRLWHYVEYSITGSLCLVVLAINVGIREVFVITGLFGLFFGMNMMGACAELFVYAAEKFKTNESRYSSVEFLGLNPTNLWLTAHWTGWILFCFGVGPVLDQYHRFRQCSERKTPDYMVALVVLEMLAFISFGAVQYWGLLARTKILRGQSLGVLSEAYLFVFRAAYSLFAEGGVKMTREDVVHCTDVWMIGLSLFAKTFLAWLLLAPALAVSGSEPTPFRVTGAIKSV